MEDITVDELENDADEEELQLTPAQVIQMLEEAWVNEKFAPEILPNKIEVVECLLEQITHMEANLEGLASGDFKKTIHQLEIDRMRFLITSYLRQRLEKIEVYVYHILKQEEERAEKGEELYLTEAELEFARSFQNDLDQHFRSVVSFHPGLPLEEWRKQPVTPNMHSFVFLKSKAEVEGVVIDDGRDEDADLVDVNLDAQMLISYKSVANLVKKGDVQLI